MKNGKRSRKRAVELTMRMVMCKREQKGAGKKKKYTS